MKIKNVLVVYYVHNYKTLEKVEHCLNENNIKYAATNRAQLTKRMGVGKDLIITVGGDGTFMRTAHHVIDTPILNVSSDVRYNEAFYAQAVPEDFEKKFKLLLAGKAKIASLPRLQAKINGKVLPRLALNEVFAGNQHPYHTSRYWISINGKKEYQKSSGVLITTPMGSFGWANSAAKKPLKIPKDGFGYVVREPYRGRLSKSTMTQGVLKKGQKVKIISDTHRGIVVLDSSQKPHSFIDGDILEVSLSKKPLRYVTF